MPPEDELGVNQFLDQIFGAINNNITTEIVEDVDLDEPEDELDWEPEPMPGDEMPLDQMPMGAEPFDDAPVQATITFGNHTAVEYTNTTVNYNNTTDFNSYFKHFINNYKVSDYKQLGYEKTSPQNFLHIVCKEIALRFQCDNPEDYHEIFSPNFSIDSNKIIDVSFPFYVALQTYYDYINLYEHLALQAASPEFASYGNIISSEFLDSFLANYNSDNLSALISSFVSLNSQSKYSLISFKNNFIDHRFYRPLPRSIREGLPVGANKYMREFPELFAEHLYWYEIIYSMLPISFLEDKKSFNCTLLIPEEISFEDHYKRILNFFEENGNFSIKALHAEADNLAIYHRVSENDLRATFVHIFVNYVSQIKADYVSTITANVNNGFFSDLLDWHDETIENFKNEKKLLMQESSSFMNWS